MPKIKLDGSRVVRCGLIASAVFTLMGCGLINPPMLPDVVIPASADCGTLLILHERVRAENTAAMSDDYLSMPNLGNLQRVEDALRRGGCIEP